jgi:hypothetical protein
VSGERLLVAAVVEGAEDIWAGGRVVKRCRVEGCDRTNRVGFFHITLTTGKYKDAADAARLKRLELFTYNEVDRKQQS